MKFLFFTIGVISSLQYCQASLTLSETPSDGDVVTAKSPRTKFLTMKEINWESLESCADKRLESGALSLSLPEEKPSLTSYSPILKELSFKKFISRQMKQKEIESPNLVKYISIKNPMLDGSLIEKGSKKQNKLMNARSNNPMFLDPKQLYGLNLPAIHELGATIRHYAIGGEGMGSYVYTTQRLINLLEECEEGERAWLDDKEKRTLGDTKELEAIQGKIRKYCNVVQISLWKISSMTGVHWSKLIHLPGIKSE